MIILFPLKLKFKFAKIFLNNFINKQFKYYNYNTD